MKNNTIIQRNASIECLLGHVGKTVSDNFSPELRSTIKSYNGDYQFTLEHSKGTRIVDYTELDMMIFGV